MFRLRTLAVFCALVAIMSAILLAARSGSGADTSEG
jgi:hypothetical protein